MQKRYQMDYEQSLDSISIKSPLEGDMTVGNNPLIEAN